MRRRFKLPYIISRGAERSDWPFDNTDSEHFLRSYDMPVAAVKSAFILFNSYNNFVKWIQRCYHFTVNEPKLREVKQIVQDCSVAK